MKIDDELLTSDEELTEEEAVALLGPNSRPIL